MLPCSQVLGQVGPPSSPPSPALLRPRTVTSGESDHHRALPYPILLLTSTITLSSTSQVQFNSLIRSIRTKRLQNDWMGAWWWIQDSGFLWVKFPSLFYFMATLGEVWLTFLASHRKHRGTRLHLQAVIPNNRSSPAPKLHTDIHSEVFNVDFLQIPRTSLGASRRLPWVAKQWKSHAVVN